MYQLYYFAFTLFETFAFSLYICNFKPIYCIRINIHSMDCALYTFKSIVKIIYCGLANKLCVETLRSLGHQLSAARPFRWQLQIYNNLWARSNDKVNVCECKVDTRPVWTIAYFRTPQICYLWHNFLWKLYHNYNWIYSEWYIINIYFNHEYTYNSLV